MNTEPGAVSVDEASPLTVPTLVEPLTVPSASPHVQSATPAAPTANHHARRPAARELASWRVLRMWPNGETLNDAVTVKLIGVHEGHSIVVTAPEDVSGMPVKAGAMYRFRSFSGETIYEFIAPLAKICSEPFEYLHIGWPQQQHVEKRELRAAPRVKTELPCMIYPGAQASGKFVKGTISDLSTGGAAIALHSDLSVFYDEVKVVFQLAIADQELMIEARARPVRKPDETGELLMGVSFVALTSAEKIALHAYVTAGLVRELEIPLYARV
ncbi:MAG TPA: PilZ domain-containing protein [Burkholderiaceae bacterium]|nr:PilZ domain-containing protein [Burkholderiaceae bacterium]